MLVKLYSLPDGDFFLRQSSQQQVSVRPAMSYEKEEVLNWVAYEFGEQARGWKSECEVAFSRMPIACWVALMDRKVIGFCCHDVTAKNVLGPIGVSADCRRGGVGRLLLLSALCAMRNQGYAYAIIGHVGPADFFRRCAGATPIAGSTPGFFPQPEMEANGRGAV
ncbi:GNAT family N-acetyltransferase [Crocinitomicaceae bacterium]|nr:GNAT family N-acetyltransferase [Crocinitomicaceae bacterium]